MKIIFFFLALNILKLNAQISGKIKNTQGNPIANSTVILKNCKSDSILIYAFGNTNGDFKIDYKIKDSVCLLINCLGYKKQNYVLLKNETLKPLSFLLLEEETVLQEVKVKNNSQFFTIKKDTTTFSVDSLKNANDRVIGDVLKKIPGIEINQNGRISYNGKNISSLYIDGDDLLDDKYSIATKSLPPEFVNKIQILERHQPIEALKNVTQSNNVAINLVIKDKAKLKIISRAEVGFGVKDLYDASFYVMSFKKKFKAINYFKTNNIGNDFNHDIAAHNYKDFLRENEVYIPQKKLSLTSSQAPIISNNRFRFNNSNLVTMNNLINLKHKWLLKLNTHFIADKNQNEYEYISTFFLTTDTLKYLEQQKTKNHLIGYKVQLQITKNDVNQYVNNVLIFERANQSDQSSLFAENNTINQQLVLKNENFSNHFLFIKPLKNKMVIEYNSLIQKNNKPESLEILPFSNLQIFNGTITLPNVNQTIINNAFVFNNSIVLRRENKNVNYSIKLDNNYQDQNMNSYIEGFSYSQRERLSNDTFINQISRKSNQINLNTSITFTKNPLKIALNTNVQNNCITAINEVNQEKQIFKQLFVNPDIFIKLKLSKNKSINANFSLNNPITNIDNIYTGKVLNNFRTISNNNTPIIKNKNEAIGLDYLYNKSEKLFAAGVNLHYYRAKNEFINKTKLENLTIFNTTSYLPNLSENYSIQFNLSKYLFKLHSSINLRFGFNIVKDQQIQNETIQKTKNNYFTAQIKSSIRVNEWLSISNDILVVYGSSYILKSNRDYKRVSNFLKLQHTADANLSISKNTSLKIKNDLYLLKQKNNFITTFLDLYLNTKNKKQTISYGFECLNLLNNNQFINFDLSANNISKSTFNLRPRLLLLKVNFNF